LSGAIAGELLFGLAMGMSLAFVFTAAQWAGEMIGQQIGFNISEVLDPQFGGGGSIMGDLFFMLTIVIFLTVGGHHALLLGVHESLRASPPLTLTMSDSLLDDVVGLFASSAVLAFRLAAPMFVTMLVVDIAIGAISKTMPQLNVLTAGLAIRGDGRRVPDDRRAARRAAGIDGRGAIVVWKRGEVRGKDGGTEGRRDGETERRE